MLPLSLCFVSRQCLGQGTFHQGELDGGGAQCTCVAVAFLCLSSQPSNPAAKVETDDIDGILRDGTALHASIAKDDKSFLMVTELPDTIVLRGVQYSLKREDAFVGCIGTQQPDMSALTLPFQHAVDQAFKTTDTCVLVIGPPDFAFTIAIRKVGDGFHCFDSHSRTAMGLRTPNGKSVLLLIKRQEGLVSYVMDLAESLFGKDRCLNMPYELTPVVCRGEKSLNNGDKNNESISNLNLADELQEESDEHSTPAKVMRLFESDTEELVPTVVRRDVFMEWKIKRPWISAKRISKTVIGVMCTSCAEIKDLSQCIQFSKERLKIADEWLKGVTADNRKKLHDKITQHEKSRAHEMCCRIMANKASMTIEKSLDKSRKVWHKQNEDRIEQTSRVFRSAYVIAWKHVSFRFLRHLYELQQQNGVAMGNMLYSHQSCSNIVVFIASEMRHRLVSFILNSENPFSLLFDESTTLANETVLILYARALDSAGIPQNCFLDLFELTDGASGEAIAASLLMRLDKMGFNSAILKSRLLAFCTDGASSLQGHTKGALCKVAKSIGRDDIITFHCMSHRLELAVHDAVSCTNTVSHLRMFMDTLYSYYSRSPKNCRQLHVASETLCVELRKIGKIFDVRWLTSSYNTVDAVLQSFSALISQLHHASSDNSSTKKDRAKAEGMSKKLRCWAVLAELALMKDILSVLKDLSLYLQSREASILDVGGRLHTAVQTLAAMKSANGLAMSDLNEQVSHDGCYRGISVNRSCNDECAFAQMRRQFLQALVDNLKARFPEQQLQEAGAVLNPATWPDDENERALFGDSSVLQLATLCKVDMRQALDDFRQYKNNYKVVGSTLKTLIQRVQLLPVSSADCERGFSCMNVNDTPVRNRLSVNALSALIFIKVNGPQPMHFNVEPYVTKWLKEGHHASADLPTGKESCKPKPLTPWAAIFG